MEPSDDNDAGAARGSEPVGERVRIFRRGRVWHANFQQGGKQHRPSLKTTSKKEARRRALKIEAELADGRWKAVKPAAGVAEAVTAYLAFLKAEDRAPKTVGKYTGVLGRVAELAARRKVKDLAGVDLAFLDAYREMRVGEGAQPKTRYTESVIVRQLINFALSRGLLNLDPLRGLRLKKPKPAPQPCWTFGQVQAILAASPCDIRAALTLLAETGMRFGELAWLTWEDVDWDANVLRVQAKPGWKPKTGDMRAVPISAAARAVLQALPRRWRWVVTMPPSARHPGPGRQWTERRLLTALQRVLKMLKLPGKLHTFRHTFISNALLKGVPPAVVREWVGQVDEAIIKLYTHVHDSASQAAMQRLGEANNQPLQPEDSADGTEADSAQNQHKREEAENGRDAK